MLVRHREDDDTAMTTSEIRDQLVTLLLAGHETTATGLAWTFERLVRNPAVLAATVRAAQEGDDAYLDAVITESLRIRPVVPDITRKVTKDITIGEGDRRAHAARGHLRGPGRLPRDARPAALPRAVGVPPGAFRRPAARPQRVDPVRRRRAALPRRRVRPDRDARRGRRGPAPRRAGPDDPAHPAARVRHVTLMPHKGAVVTVRRRLYPAEPSDERLSMRSTLARSSGVVKDRSSAANA